MGKAMPNARTIYVTDMGLWEAAKKVAKERNISMSELIKEALLMLLRGQ